MKSNLTIAKELWITWKTMDNSALLSHTDKHQQYLGKMQQHLTDCQNFLNILNKEDELTWKCEQEIIPDLQLTIKFYKEKGIKI